MLSEILKEVLSREEIEGVLKYPIVTFCLFRSFDEMTKNLIYRMMMNDSKLERKDLLGRMAKGAQYRQNEQKFDRAMQNLKELRVITQQGTDKAIYKLNQNFQQRLCETITNNILKMNGEILTAEERNCNDFFNLMNLLDQGGNKILSDCGLNRMNGKMTKSVFDFIRSPLEFKVAILIKGVMLKKKRQGNYSIVKDILYLCNLNSSEKYKIKDKISGDFLSELESIRLVRLIDNTHYMVSPHLKCFVGIQSKQKLLNCNIIIESNFKVYVQIPKTNNCTIFSSNYRLIKNILHLLIKIEHEEYNFEELIVGQINYEKLKPLFMQKISVNEFLGFFRQFMQSNLSIEKDLGKWNKINFLGLEGPIDEMMIPNNVKQQLKLWQSLYKNGNEDMQMVIEQDYY